MVANQQLKDYISQQTKLGVSKDAMRSALLGAGWNESDVTQAMTESEVGTQAAAAQPAQPVQPAVSAQPIQQPVQQPSSPVSGIAATISGMKPAAPFMTSDIFQPKGEAVFKSSAPGQPAVQKPAAVSINAEPGKNKGNVLTIVLGVISVLLLGGNVYFYFQSTAKQPQAPAITGTGTGQQQEAQIASLTTDKNTLTQQVDTLNKTMADLSGQLAIFEPASTSTITSVSFDVSGTLGGGGKVLYSLTTSRNIILSVKNSKDAKVEAALKDLIGKQISLQGTHQPGSVSLTVVSVNNQPVDAPVVATSTTPAATTTTAAPAAAAPGGAAATTPPAGTAGIAGTAAGTAAAPTTTAPGATSTIP